MPNYYTLFLCNVQKTASFPDGILLFLLFYFVIGFPPSSNSKHTEFMQ